MELDEKTLYPMIFKRKSFHLFRNTGNLKISQEELNHIKALYETLCPLYPHIKTTMKIVSADFTPCKRGQEYCLLLYSEKKDNYLQNIGFIGQQLDLYLASLNIGSLWYGIGKVEEEIDHMEFVIMLAIKKIDDESKFRKNMFKSKRKPLEDIWKGDYIDDISHIVRFAPSACNLQPWLVEYEHSTLKVYRYQISGKRGIMPANKVIYYSRIDMGIFLCFLQLCLQHRHIDYTRCLYDDFEFDQQKTLCAIYQINEGGNVFESFSTK